MQSTSVASFPSSSSYPIPNLHLLRPHRLRAKAKTFLALSFSSNQTHFPKPYALDLSTATSCSTQHDDKINFSYPVHDLSLFQQFYSSADPNGPSEQNPDPRNRRDREEEKIQSESGGFANMWWAELKAALGQRLNVEGIVSSAAVVLRDRHLLLPHVSVPDIRCVDWVELHRRGFKGVVFDKDNTITVPYSLTLWGPLGDSIDRCKSVFGDDIAVFSNSAGLFEYDRNGSKARQLEAAIGIKVIRHKVKKPAGSAEEVEEHFGCDSSQLIMVYKIGVGDRPFTDIVYGNRNGFLTILTEPLSLREEPFIVRLVRKLETSLLKYWVRRGRKPAGHILLPDPNCCLKDSPHL